MDELRAAVQPYHERMQVLPYFAGIEAGTASLQGYLSHLRAFAIIHGALEQECNRATHPAIVAVWRTDMCKHPLLDADLRYFSPRQVDLMPEAATHAMDIAEIIHHLGDTQPLALLGFVYVLEGAGLGARQLAPMVARCFDLRGGEGLAYFNAHGEHTRERWAAFTQRMNETLQDSAEISAVREAAVSCFEHLFHVFTVAAPRAGHAKLPTLAAINPDAGSHPIPTDPAEMEAALRAAEACWLEFPYFAQRYGERGRRFARSDSAWLVTLAEYTPDAVVEQVDWLGGLLAARGMPTLTLQRHLEVLHAELISTLSGRQEHYAPLLSAAKKLAKRRTDRLPRDREHALVDAFYAETGANARTRHPDAGRLVVAAVADECNGIPAAGEALIGWYSAPDRFPQPWCIAVERLAAEARAAAQPT
jgi:heme oxygenase